MICYRVLVYSCINSWKSNCKRKIAMQNAEMSRLGGKLLEDLRISRDGQSIEQYFNVLATSNSIEEYPADLQKIAQEYLQAVKERGPVETWPLGSKRKNIAEK